MFILKLQGARAASRLALIHADSIEHRVGDRPWPFSCSPRDQHADLSVLTIRGVVNEEGLPLQRSSC